MARKLLDKNFWNNAQPVPFCGCLIWMGHITEKLYGTINIKGKTWRAHRLAWTITYGKIPDGLCVLHHCDTPSCIEPRHLFLGNNADNALDSAKKGRRLKGEKSPQAKLSEFQVRQILTRYAAGGIYQKELGKAYGITQATVQLIVTRQIWKHLDAAKPK